MTNETLQNLKKEDIQVLNLPTSENFILVTNYPYGFKKTNARYWAETSKKGQRVVFQTQNPKTLIWNKPKKSTYDDLVVFYKENSTGHIKNTGLNFSYDGLEDLSQFLEIFGEVLNDYQKKQLKVFKAIIETRKHISYKIVENDNLSELERKNKNIEDQEKLNKLFNFYLKEGEKADIDKQY